MNFFFATFLESLIAFHTFARKIMIIAMIKKFILSIVLLLASSFSDVIAQIKGEKFCEEIVLHTTIIDPNKDKSPIKRSPIRIPSVSIDAFLRIYQSLKQFYMNQTQRVLKMLISMSLSIYTIWNHCILDK